MNVPETFQLYFADVVWDGGLFSEKAIVLIGVRFWLQDFRAGCAFESTQNFPP